MGNALHRCRRLRGHWPELICDSIDQRVSGGGDCNRRLLSAKSLFNNIRVSKVAAILVAFFPSLILWSSQALKDALIILALALAILATLRLMEKVTVGLCVGFELCSAGALESSLLHLLHDDCCGCG